MRQRNEEREERKMKYSILALLSPKTRAWLEMAAAKSNVDNCSYHACPTYAIMIPEEYPSTN